MIDMPSRLLTFRRRGLHVHVVRYRSSFENHMKPVIFVMQVPSVKFYRDLGPSPNCLGMLVDIITHAMRSCRHSSCHQILTLFVVKEVMLQMCCR